MSSILAFARRVEDWVLEGMAERGVVILRVCLGIVFFWFGVLKFFPGTSPAEDLAARTIHVLTFGLLPDKVSLLLLAAWETGIGIGLITGRCLRATLALLFLQMSGTVLPMFFFPHETFVRWALVPTMEGQYILKNLVLVSAGMVIGGNSHRQRQEARREVAARSLSRAFTGEGAVSPPA